MNTSPLTKAQIHVIDVAEGLCKRFKENRWFTQIELPDNPNIHPLNSLVEKNYLERRTENGVMYYRRMKEKRRIKGNVVYSDIVPKDTIVLDADDVVVSIGYPTELSEDDAIAIAKEFINDEWDSADERSSHGE